MILACPSMWVNAVLLHQVSNAAIELCGYAAALGDDGRPVLAGIVEVDSPLLTVGDGFIPEFGIVEQCLTWDTPPVEAYAAEFVPFDNGSLHAKLSSADGTDVSAGAAADDDEIEVVVRCHRTAPN